MGRILVLTELLPYPLVSGAKIRAYYVLRHLAAAHKVTLLSFVRADDRPDYVAHLESIVDKVHVLPIERSLGRNLRAAAVSLATGRPAIIAREDIRPMRRQVDRLLGSGQFDLVHADQIPMAQYALQGKQHGVKALLDQHNATFQILARLAQHEGRPLKRLLLRREARAFARYEVDVCARFDAVTFVSQEDRRALAAQMRVRPGPSWDQVQRLERSAVIPICIDTQLVPPVKTVDKPFRVTQVGTMFWPPNVEGLEWFTAEVWPRVHAEAPWARLTLIGKNPPERLRMLDAREDVDVLGYVEDLTPLLAETAASIVPLRAAGGMRVKIVDAWCWGLPIVSTAIGAEGITVRDGENILIADTPDDFSAALLGVLADAGLQARLKRSGRAWVEQHYDWRLAYQAWDSVLEGLLADR